MKYNVHIISDAEKDLYLNKLIQINLQKLVDINKRFSPNLVNTKTALKHGIIKLNNTNFQYAIHPKEHFGNVTSQFLLDKGVTTSSCVLKFSISRRYGANNNVKIYLNYLEDISNFQDFGVESCVDWKEINFLNYKQKKFLQNFENSIKNILKVSDYK